LKRCLLPLQDIPKAIEFLGDSEARFLIKKIETNKTTTKKLKNI